MKRSPRWHRSWKCKFFEPEVQKCRYAIFPDDKLSVMIVEGIIIHEISILVRANLYRNAVFTKWMFCVNNSKFQRVCPKLEIWLSEFSCDFVLTRYVWLMKMIRSAFLLRAHFAVHRHDRDEIMFPWLAATSRFIIDKWWKTNTKLHTNRQAHIDRCTD